MNLKVKVEEAIEALQEHRARHVQDYKEALVTWREDLAAYTSGLTAWAVEMQGNRPAEPSAPRNYLGEYDKLINKLNRHYDELIILNDTEYSTIFEDDFYWQSSFQRQKAPIYTIASADTGKTVNRDIPANLGSISADKIISGALTTNNMKLKLSDGLHVPLEED